MQPDFRQQSRSNAVIWVVLAIVGGAFVVCAGLVCGGAFLLTKFGNDIGEEISAELQAEDFLDELDAGDFRLAYQMTSSGFQARHDVGWLETLVDQHPFLGDFSDRETDTKVHVSGTQYTLKADITDWDGRRHTATIDMVKENGEWRVDDVTVP